MIQNKCFQRNVNNLHKANNEQNKDKEKYDLVIRMNKLDPRMTFVFTLINYSFSFLEAQAFLYFPLYMCLSIY